MNDATATAPAIEVVDLVKTFERGLLQAINGASFSVGAGEWVSLCGPSGCGKSTLLHLIAALDRPTSGQIRINGHDLAKIRDIDHYRQFEIGLVFQLHNLLPNLTAVQNIEVALFGSPLSHKAQRERARELLDAVGLGGRPEREATRALRRPATAAGHRARARERAIHPSRRRTNGKPRHGLQPERARALPQDPRGAPAHDPPRHPQPRRGRDRRPHDLDGGRAGRPRAGLSAGRDASFG